MPLPDNLTYVTVTGQVAEGTSQVVVFKTPTWLAGTPFVPRFGISAVIQPDGSFSAELPATDDPAWEPVGWAYDVLISVDGQILSGTLAVPMATVGSIALGTSLVIDAPSDSGTVAYLLQSARGQAGGVAGLDADGDVVNADGDKITGGGGGSTDWADITGKPSTFTPSLHAASHGSAGSDPVSLSGSQITSGTVATARLSTGTGSSNVSLGDHAHATLAALASPTFTGDPKAPTPVATDRDTSLATTAHVWSVQEQCLNLLTSGEEVLPRDIVSSEVVFDTGTVFLSYFTARKSETISSCYTGTGGTGFTGTVARIGVFSVSGGTLTRVAVTNNDTGLWSGTYTTYNKPFASSWSKVAGTRYALGYLCIGSVMPQVECAPIRYHSARLAPAIQGELSGQTDMPTSISEASLGGGYRRFQGILLP